jgi:hypothetical protein
VPDPKTSKIAVPLLADWQIDVWKEARETEQALNRSAHEVSRAAIPTRLPDQASQCPLS